MITIPAGVRIYLACGPTDMRKGFDGLSMLAQDVLKQDAFERQRFAECCAAQYFVLGRDGRRCTCR